MRIYSMPLQANTPVDIVVAGNFVRILSASANVQVSIDSGEFLTLSQGLSIRPDGGYQRLRVLSATEQQVDIAAGFGSIDDSRLSVTAPLMISEVTTPVSIVDSGISRSLSGNAYSWRNDIAAQNGYHNWSEIYNPVGSGLRCIITDVSCLVAAGATVQFAVGDTTLTYVPFPKAGYTGRVVSKLVSTPVGFDSGGMVTAYGGETAITSIMPSNAQFQTMFIGALNGNGAMIGMRLEEPVILRPGTGIRWYTDTPNVRLLSNIEYFVEPDA